MSMGMSNFDLEKIKEELSVYDPLTKERMLAKILDTYKFELEHGVPESQSKMAELLKEIGRDEDEGED